MTAVRARAADMSMRHADRWTKRILREPSGGSLRRVCEQCLRISLAELGRLQDKCALFVGVYFQIVAGSAGAEARWYFVDMMAVAILLVTVREREYSPSLTLYFYDTYRRWCGTCARNRLRLRRVKRIRERRRSAGAASVPCPSKLPFKYKLHATILLQLGQSRRRRGVKKLS